MDKRKALKVSAIIICAVAVVLTTYALIQYYGQIVTHLPVEQAVWVDGKRFNETIAETLTPTYGGCTVYANHTLENKGDSDAKVMFALVNITDSQGNLVTDNSIEVSWLLEGQTVVLPITVSAHAIVEFSIGIHFHYAVMPDTYTINTQVKPYIP